MGEYIDKLLGIDCDMQSIPNTFYETILENQKTENSELGDFWVLGKIWGRIPQIVEFALTFSTSKASYFDIFYIISEFLIYLLLENPTS